MNHILRVRLQTEYFLSDITTRILLVATQLADDQRYSREEAALELREIALVIRDERCGSLELNPHEGSDIKDATERRSTSDSHSKGPCEHSPCVHSYRVRIDAEN